MLTAAVQAETTLIPKTFNPVARFSQVQHPAYNDALSLYPIQHYIVTKKQKNLTQNASNTN